MTNAFTKYFEKRVEIYKRAREVATHPVIIKECNRMIEFYGGRKEREMYLGAEMGDWRERNPDLGGLDGRNH